MSESAEQLLAKERITSKFFQESERAALQALERVTSEWQTVKKDLDARDAMIQQLQRDLGIAATVNTNLQRQCSLLQAELGEKVKELTKQVAQAEETKKKADKSLSLFQSELNAEKEASRLLHSQVTILAECVKANPAVPSYATIPDQLARDFDLQHWTKKCESLQNEVQSLRRERDDAAYLWREERMEAQRANVLLLCSQKLLESLQFSPGGTSMASILHMSSAQQQEDLMRLQEVVHSLTASQLSELIQETTRSRQELQRLQSQLSLSSGVASDLKQECADLKKQLVASKEKEKSLLSEVQQLRAARLILEREEKLRMLEQGSVAAILMTFFTAPSRCPHCRGGLSDTLGLDLLAEATGCTDVNELVRLMVSSVANKISTVYREAFLDQVTVITPPTSLGMAHELLGPLPQGLYFLPPTHMAAFLGEAQFVSESQAYALVAHYMTVGPRFTPSSQDVVDALLDQIRFLWLGTAFLENEIARVEQDIINMRASSGMGGSGRLTEVVAPGTVLPRSPHLALLIPRSLLARLTQALRIRSSALQFRGSAASTADRTSSGGLVVPPMFSGNSKDNAIVHELQRLRRSFAFLPRTVRDMLPDDDGLLGRSLSIETLIELQVMAA